MPRYGDTRRPKTGEQKEIDGEIPVFAIYRIEGYDEEEEEPWEEERVEYEGKEWIVVDNGVNMVEIDGEEDS